MYRYYAPVVEEALSGGGAVPLELVGTEAVGSVDDAFVVVSGGGAEAAVSGGLAVSGGEEVAV